jgi:transposase-like protein
MLKRAEAERWRLETPDGVLDMLCVKCPSCKHEYWVKAGPYLAGRRVKLAGEDKIIVYRTSSCPHCFKTHRRPNKSTIN